MYYVNCSFLYILYIVNIVFYLYMCTSKFFTSHFMFTCLHYLSILLLSSLCGVFCIFSLCIVDKFIFELCFMCPMLYVDIYIFHITFYVHLFTLFVHIIIV